eukprot:CAMPEP_0198250554 /NCGR_PEP_ID=MMETSP1447-20131203/1697_1 /TAXON_ID=420782 /ORGANISM="Chaetoceros dichaeta, Strain CCMP1751" /LENGTH=365 /DNA_ID=CAMNT_0043935401 /DNA_START=127 /DNA_END=1224 /DNA_ORIENTATION=-
MTMISSSTPALLLQNDASSKTMANTLSDTEAVNCVVVHPLVLLSVLDHHTRRQEGAGRVIGTLLGRRDGDKVEVTNCFPVPHAERGDEEVAIGKDFNRQMLALHLRCNPTETVIGWYATAFPITPTTTDESNTTTPNTPPPAFPSITDTSSLIHDFYASECDETVIDAPVHLFVDTSFNADSISLKAYKSSAITLRGEPLANMFHEVRLVLKSSESERIAVNEMIKAQELTAPAVVPPVTTGEEEGTGGDVTTTTTLTDAGGEKTLSSSSTNSLQHSMETLLSMLETASDYVHRVVDGSVPADDDVGRQIADTLSSVPRVRPEAFDKMFSDSLQDLLMITYLSNITRTQLTIAEKLNASLDQNLK